MWALKYARLLEWKKKQAVYVVNISAGDKDTLVIKKIIIMETLFVFFECTIVNLATYRQCLLKRKKQQQQQKNKTKKKQQQQQQKSELH